MRINILNMIFKKYIMDHIDNQDLNISVIAEHFFITPVLFIQNIQRKE